MGTTNRGWVEGEKRKEPGIPHPHPLPHGLLFSHQPWSSSQTEKQFFFFPFNVYSSSGITGDLKVPTSGQREGEEPGQKAPQTTC